MPALRDLLALLNADARRPLIYIEIKTDPQDPADAADAETITDAVFDEVEAANYAARTKIIAFEWKVLRLARARNPKIATAHLTVPEQLAHQVKPLPNGDSPWTDGFDPRRFGGSVFAAVKAHGGVEWSPYFTRSDGRDRGGGRARQGSRLGPWGLSASADIKRMIALGVFSATVSGPAWG